MRLFYHQRTVRTLMILRNLAITAAIAALMASSAIAEEFHEREGAQNITNCRATKRCATTMCLPCVTFTGSAMQNLNFGVADDGIKPVFWDAAAGGGLPRDNGIFMNIGLAPIRSWSRRSPILNLWR